MHALVTGASGGLGEAYCEHLAEQGHDLVLVSRRAEELERVASRLRERYGVDAQVVVADLSEEQARDEVFAEVGRRGITVDFLVNNAGFGTIDDVVDIDPARLNDEIALNCGALVHLSRLFLPGMMERGSGSIVNVASTAAFQPVPGMAVYAATKAFVLSFTQALWDEARHHGVRVIAICPGPTETSFFKVAGDDRAMTQRRTPEQVVRTTFRGLERGLPHIVDGPVNATGARFATFVPVRLLNPITRRVLGR